MQYSTVQLLPVTAHLHYWGGVGSSVAVVSQSGSRSQTHGQAKPVPLNQGAQKRFFPQKIWQLTESDQEQFIKTLICFVNLKNNWFVTTFQKKNCYWEQIYAVLFFSFIFCHRFTHTNEKIQSELYKKNYALHNYRKRMFSILARPYFLIKFVSQEMMTIREQGGRIIVIWKHFMKIQELLTNSKVSLKILLVRGSYNVRLPVNLWLFRGFIWIQT